MVSRVRYFSFKEYGFLKITCLQLHDLLLCLCSLLILSQPVVFGFLLGAIYLLSGPIYTYIILPRRNRPAPREPYAELTVDGALIQGREGNLIRAVPCPSLRHMRSFSRKTSNKTV